MATDGGVDGRRSRGVGALARAIAVALPLTAGLCPAGPAWSDESPMVRSGSAAPATVIPMGDVTLRIPDNYLFGSIYYEAGNRTVEDFRIQVLLPDMEPQTPANTPEFQMLGWGRKLYASLAYKGPSATGPKLFNIMMKTAERFVEGRVHVTGTDRSGPFTITHQQFQTDDQVVFTGTRDKPGYFARCSSLDHASPDCERIILIAPDIYVDYYFSRLYLDDYAGIEQRLLARLNSFRIHGKTFEVIQ